MARSSSYQLWVALGSAFSPGLQQCFPAAWASPSASSRSDGLRISMSRWRTCCQGWRCHSLCTSTQMCWLLGSLRSCCCLSASHALAHKIPAAWDMQTEVIEDTVVPLREVTVPQSSLHLWEVSVVLSKVQLIASSGLPEAAVPSLQQCWHFPQQGKGNLETWQPICK